VREIEAALLDRRIDLAVHSAKDLPSEDRPGLTLAAFCERGDPRDALVSPRHGRFADLPAGALVATSSPRRIAQLRHARPDLRFTEIRGNVDTRLEKLARGDADALVLAVAGLARLGRQSAATETLEPELCLPQVGQACVAVQCRAATRPRWRSWPGRATTPRPGARCRRSGRSWRASAEAAPRRSPRSRSGRRAR
jgi:hydroxymethylbilane synthase